MALYVRETKDKGVTRVDVVDINTGETLSADSTSSQFDEVKAVINTMVADGAELGAIRVETEKLQGKDIYEDVRKQLGITLDKDGTIHLPGDVTLPADVAGVFQEMTTLEQGKHLLEFAKLLSSNPYEHARASLIEWICANPSLSILPDGRIRGFRGLSNNLTSIHSGYGIVDGVEMIDNLPNKPGSVLEFPAEMADHNPNHTCSVGLHVGTKKYALDFGVRWVTVAFSPADVISFPNDGTSFKIRVTKFEVLEEVSGSYMHDTMTP